MSSFISNKNYLNWIPRTRVITFLSSSARFHRHTGQHNVYSIYTLLQPELDFDQNYKVLEDILKFPEHQESYDLESYNSSYASINKTDSFPLFFRISGYQTLSEKQLNSFIKLGKLTKITLLA